MAKVRFSDLPEGVARHNKIVHSKYSYVVRH